MKRAAALLIPPVLTMLFLGEARMCVELLAGRPGPADTPRPVGEVCVDNDGNDLHVEFKSADGWVLLETQLVAAASMEGIPRGGSGQPQLGRFPYRETHSPSVSIFTYSIPLSELGVEPDAKVVIAAHASMSQGGEEEGAWASGKRFTEEGHPGTYFTYSIAEPQ